MSNESSLVYGCLTHVPLGVSFPSYVTPIYLGEAQGEGRLNLRDLAPEWEEYHPFLGGLAGTFALKNHILSSRPSAKRVGVCQYRKFVSRIKAGWPSKNFGTMLALSKQEFAFLDPDALMAPGNEDFLVGEPGHFILNANGVSMDYLEQYNLCHHAEDLLRLTAEAVASGILEKQNAVSFLRETIFFTGGIELGVFPADFWIRTVEAIEVIVRACFRRFSDVRREGYQARNWAFCVERLGSYLLLTHLRETYPEPHWRTQFVGHLHLINEDENLMYVPGT